MEELASILSVIQRVQTFTHTRFFIAKECQYALFQQAIYWTYSKGSHGFCEGTLGTQFISAGL
jgi:hypothetical protein